MARRYPTSSVNKDPEHLQSLVVVVLYLVLFGFVIKKDSGKIILSYQKKSCFCLELDTKTQPYKTPSHTKKIAEHTMYETAIKVGLGRIWIWIAIEPSDKGIWGFNISNERNMLDAENLVSGRVKL